MPAAPSIRRTWFRLLAVGPLVLLIAFLPSLVYLDHVSAYVTYVVRGPGPREESVGALAHTRHAEHCHYGPSACSEQPAPTGVRVLPEVVEVPAPELPSVAVEDAVAQPEEVLAAPPTEPPRPHGSI
jgi:hypothetical protein